MDNRIAQFFEDESGQDLIEYTLLMAFLAMASAAIVASVGSPLTGMWASANTQFASANLAAS